MILIESLRLVFNVSLILNKNNAELASLINNFLVQFQSKTLFIIGNWQRF